MSTGKYVVVLGGLLLVPWVMAQELKPNLDSR